MPNAIHPAAIDVCKMWVRDREHKRPDAGDGLEGLYYVNQHVNTMRMERSYAWYVHIHKLAQRCSSFTRMWRVQKGAEGVGVIQTNTSGSGRHLG